MGTIEILVQCPATTREAAQDNISGVNMPTVDPTVGDMNRILSYGASANSSAEQKAGTEEPAFGTHIREAVEIIRDWVGDPKES